MYGLLDQIQSYFNNDSQGLGGQLTGFYNAAQDLAADPTSGSARDDFLASAGKVANQFRSIAHSFAGTRTGIRQDVDQTVARINEIGRSLSSLNSRDRKSTRLNSSSQCSPRMPSYV